MQHRTFTGNPTSLSNLGKVLFRGTNFAALGKNSALFHWPSRRVAIIGSRVAAKRRRIRANDSANDSLGVARNHRSCDRRVERGGTRTKPVRANRASGSTKAVWRRRPDQREGFAGDSGGNGSRQDHARARWPTDG